MREMKIATRIIQIGLALVSDGNTKAFHRYKTRRVVIMYVFHIVSKSVEKIKTHEDHGNRSWL